MYLINKSDNRYEVLIENLDDLWVLSQIISPNDVISSKSQRKVKIGESDKNYKVVTKVVFIEIAVKSVIFESEFLRISGKVINESEFVNKGSFHSLKFFIGDKINFMKISPFLNYQEVLFDRALNSKKNKCLLFLVERERLIVVEFSDLNFKVLSDVSFSGFSKRSNLNLSFSESVFSILKSIKGLDNYDLIVVAGPSIYKEKVQRIIKERFGLKSILHNWLDVRKAVIPKVIKSISESKVISESQFSIESHFVNLFLKNISIGEKFVYGKNIFSAIENGSVDVLLVSTNYINKSRENDEFLKINEYLILVERLNGKVVIIDSRNEAGRIVDNFGGVCAILRY